MATVVTPGERTLAVTRSSDSMVQAWDLNTGEQVGQPLTGHEHRVVTVVVPPDGRTLAVTGSDDGTVRVWDLNSGEQVGQPLTGHEDRVIAVTTVVTP
ncbi:WD40 repeat domain-containing protein, partial [Pseudonocardia sp. D17]|uniref:WD40 repeat domain-containing protein n=1 Tax=Pseudonocardia sp. D17 TaxID=882661 RepID=UPI00403EFEB1